MAVTATPLDYRRRPIEEAVMPFPKPEMTPPLTKINFISNQRETPTAEIIIKRLSEDKANRCPFVQPEDVPMAA